MEALFEMMMGGGGPGMMFAGGGGGGGRGSGSRRRRGEDIALPLEVTLEDLYTGTQATLPRTKSVQCHTCHGAGCKPGSKSTQACTRCRGAGMVMQAMGPFMTQAPCSTCNGLGTTIAEKDKCTACRGSRMVQESHPLQVNVLPGMKHEEQIPFMGEGDESTNYAEPGDVIVVLQCKEHPTFKRRGSDLVMKMEISLAQSLCGADLSFRHLDGRKIHIKPPQGKIIEPDSTFRLKGEGMPIRTPQMQQQQQRRGSSTATGLKGDLYLEFTVVFPRHLTEESVKLLESVLPLRPQTAPCTEEHEECYVTPAPLDEIRKQLKEETISDDDEDSGERGAGGARRGGSGGTQVRCAQQ